MVKCLKAPKNYIMKIPTLKKKWKTCPYLASIKKFNIFIKIFHKFEGLAKRLGKYGHKSGSAILHFFRNSSCVPSLPYLKTDVWEGFIVLSIGGHLKILSLNSLWISLRWPGFVQYYPIKDYLERKSWTCATTDSHKYYYYISFYSFTCKFMEYTIRNKS